MGSTKTSIFLFWLACGLAAYFRGAMEPSGAERAFWFWAPFFVIVVGALIANAQVPTLRKWGYIVSVGGMEAFAGFHFGVVLGPPSSVLWAGLAVGVFIVMMALAVVALGYPQIKSLPTGRLEKVVNLLKG